MISGARFARPFLAVALGCVLMLAQTVANAERVRPAKWDVAQLMRELSQVKQVQRRFVERKYLAMLTQPLEFSGTLSYRAPDHLEKRTLLPHPELMVLDGDKLTLENPAKNQRRTFNVQAYPAIWALVESIRSTLAGDLKTLNWFYRVGLEGDATQWRLSLIPSEPDMQTLVTQIQIRGSGARIEGIEVLERNGDRSVMTISEPPA